jgi:uncharacterized protein YeaO (DUF488 family)
MPIQVKHIYEPVAQSDGLRILVDRTWPQGISRFDARISHWLHGVAPSIELRRWFNQKSERWDEFRRLYLAELVSNPAVGELRMLTKNRSVSLLYAARDKEHNHARILAAHLGSPSSRPQQSPTRDRDAIQHIGSSRG